MSELISGKEALIALANGEEVEYISKGWTDTKYWSDSEKTKNFTIHDFYSGSWVFRLKPRTITINGIEVPAPFEPKLGEKYWIIETSDKNSYSYISSFENDEQDKSLTKLGAWRTEEEIKQVVSALRSVFKGGV